MTGSLNRRQGAGVTASPEFDVITIGDMCVDLIVNLGQSAVRFGQAEQWVSDYTLEMGGSACLFACQAAKLGLGVGILGRVGDDDYGRLVVRRLQESGVDTRFVAVDPALKTGLGIALCRAQGDRAILTYGGSLNAVYPEDLTEEFLSGGRHLHYGSYYLQTHLRSHVPDMLRRTRAQGLTISLDPNWDPEERWNGGLERAIASADLFLCNEQEALAITGKDDVEGAVRALLLRAPIVAVKRGAQGAWVGAGGQIQAVPVEPVGHIVDTVGAGDSFDAGFLAAWLRGMSPAQCAAIGVRCGRATVMAPGGLIGQLTVDKIPEFSPITRPS